MTLARRGAPPPLPRRRTPTGLAGHYPLRPSEGRMPVLPSSITDPLWDQFQALLPKREAAVHPLGCHRPRIRNRVVFDKLLARLVLGGTYQQHADYICSATTMRAGGMSGSPSAFSSGCTSWRWRHTTRPSAWALRIS